MQNNPLVAVPPTTRHFDNWLKAYADYTDNTEAPKNFRSWTAMSTIAGALGRKAWVNIGRFQLSPAMYVVFVAPPGVATKSTTAKQGIDLLKEVGKINLFSGTITRQAILDELEDGQQQVMIGNKALTMSSLTMFASELGVLLGGFDMQLIDDFVDMWDNKPELEKRTRGEGKKSIARPCLNMIGCTTPAWLQDNAKAYNIDGGLFSRTVFVYADKKEKLIAYPEESESPEFKSKLISDLRKISEMRGEFILTDEAKEWGSAWYAQLHTNPPDHLKNELFAAYISRRQAHLHKAALCLCAASAQDQIITLEHMVIAEALLEESERGLGRVYQALMVSEKTQAYGMILKLIDAFPNGITKNDLFRMMGNRCTLSEFEAGIQAATFAQQIRLKDAGKEYKLFPMR